MSDRICHSIGQTHVTGVKEKEKKVTRSVRIVLADDHEIIREGIKSLVSRIPDLEIVGEAATGQAAVEMVRHKRPDVVLLDTKMPIMDGIEASRQIRREFPDIKIILFSGDHSNYVFRELAGADISGVMLKGSLFTELENAVRTVIRDNKYLDSEARKLMAMDYANVLRGDHAHNDKQLNKDEYYVLEQLTQGRSVGQIALYLNKSPKTIDARKRNILRKLGLSNIVELTKYAIREGLTTADV